MLVSIRNVIGQRIEELCWATLVNDDGLGTRVFRQKDDSLATDFLESSLSNRRPTRIAPGVRQKVRLVAKPLQVSNPSPFFLHFQQALEFSTLDVSAKTPAADGKRNRTAELG